MIVRDGCSGSDRLAIDRAEGGRGLPNMRERLLAVQGSFEVESSPGRGTRVSVYVPLAGVTI